MKVRSRTQLEAIFIYLLLAFILSALVFIYFRLDNSLEETSSEILEEKSRLVHRELDNFFLPIENKLDEEWYRLYRGEFDNISTPDLVRHFFSTIQSHPLISGCFISDVKGNHMYTTEMNSGTWFSTQIFTNPEKVRTENFYWKLEGMEIQQVGEHIKPTFEYNPTEKTWFQNSISTEKIVWTPPYDFQVGQVSGITVSKRLESKDTFDRVISFDVTLTDLSTRTSQIKVGENGYAFVVSQQGNLVGLPKIYGDNIDTLNKNSLKNIKDSKFPVLKKSFEVFEKGGFELKHYKYSLDGEDYMVSFSEYKLNGITFYAGTLLPRKDIVQSMSSTRNFLVYAMVFILLITLVIAHVYRRRNVLHSQLEIEKSKLDLQKTIVEEKNKEIIDSINYAKRIQKAILPPATHVNDVMRNGFILYEPKDIVAGDFYWISELSKEKFLFAACDCTGHGVPGAMVSVICNNGLNRAVNEFDIEDTGELLDKTREIVVKEFEKSEDEVKDGMDLSLVKIEKSSGKVFLQYSGAMNPLWLIRNRSNEIEVFKGTKQPIGKVDNPQRFEKHDLELKKGDRIYLFTDGFADQFGGEKGKKMKAKRFQEFLLSIQNQKISDQKDSLLSYFSEWKGNLEQIDDVCVIGYEIN